LLIRYVKHIYFLNYTITGITSASFYTKKKLHEVASNT